ncbi:MAG: ribosome biogenesis GTPase Der [Ilumatobacteraceae bacterium]
MDQPLPTVVIVGRPNVGKSTLFNRIIGKQAAIVEDRPGVTRDRKELEAEWLGHAFSLVDTGGWLPGGSELDEKVSRQVEKAVKDADLVLFVVDTSAGLTDDDASIAHWLRKEDVPVLLVTNKADNDRRELEMWEFLALGIGDPYSVSGLHGRRAGDLLDEVIARIPYVEADFGEGPTRSEEDEEAIAAVVTGEKPPRVAIVGRPNVGKSTLFNRLVGEDRSVVHDMAGTTRDAIDTVVDTEDGPIVFVDTAGMRRKSKIDDSAEYYSLVRALRAVDESDIALLVIDSIDGVTAQDQRLAERIDAAGCPIVVLINKWEMLDDAEDRTELNNQIADRLHFVGDAPVLKISALTGKGVHKLRPVLQEAIERYHRRVPTQDVNRVIAKAQQKQPAPHGIRILYALQGANDPPTFTLFANREVPQTYLRYIERSIREAFDFGAVPIKLRVRRRSS